MSHASHRTVPTSKPEAPAPYDGAPIVAVDTYAIIASASLATVTKLAAQNGGAQ